MWHRFLQELTHSLFGLERDLVPREWLALELPSLHHPVTVSRMFVTYLQLMLVLVRFHEEASLDVE